MLQTNKSFAFNLFSTLFCLIDYLFVYSNICSMLHLMCEVFLACLFVGVCVAKNGVKKITMMWNMLKLVLLWKSYVKVYEGYIVCLMN